MRTISLFIGCQPEPDPPSKVRHEVGRFRRPLVVRFRLGQFRRPLIRRASGRHGAKELPPPHEVPGLSGKTFVQK